MEKSLTSFVENCDVVSLCGSVSVRDFPVTDKCILDTLGIDLGPLIGRKCRLMVGHLLRYTVIKISFLIKKENKTKFMFLGQNSFDEPVVPLSASKIFLSTRQQTISNQVQVLHCRKSESHLPETSDVLEKVNEKSNYMCRGAYNSYVRISITHFGTLITDFILVSMHITITQG